MTLLQLTNHKNEAIAYAESHENCCEIPGSLIAAYVRQYNPETATGYLSSLVESFIRSFFTEPEAEEEFQEFLSETAWIREMVEFEDEADEPDETFYGISVDKKEASLDSLAWQIKKISTT